MEHTTKAHLESMIDTLNQMHPMEGAKFALDYAYGGVRLVKRYDKTGGESDLSIRGTKTEIYNIMRAIEAAMRA